MVDISPVSDWADQIYCLYNDNTQEVRFVCTNLLNGTTAHRVSVVPFGSAVKKGSFVGLRAGERQRQRQIDRERRRAVGSERDTERERV